MSQRPALTADERLAREFRMEIEAGRLPHGSLLSPTKVLAKERGVSATTVSRAMARLVDEGIVIAGPKSRVVNYPAGGDSDTGQRPIVVLVGGYAGSGKTELGRILARTTHWPMLDKDSTTRAVVEAALSSLGLSPHDRESDTYHDVIRPAEYAALLTATQENLECGSSVIATAPFVSEFADASWCAQTKSLVAMAGGTVHFVWVSCDAGSMYRYIRQRDAARDTAKLANWQKWIDSIDLNFRPAVEHTVINNSLTADAPPLQQQADTLLATIAQQTKPAS